MIAAPVAGLETATEAVVDVDGVPMSALVSAVQQPRAVIVALHGGATTSAYFDAPGQPRLSLLRAGAALGFTVVAWTGRVTAARRRTGTGWRPPPSASTSRLPRSTDLSERGPRAPVYS